MSIRVRALKRSTENPVFPTKTILLLSITLVAVPATADEDSIFTFRGGNIIAKCDGEVAAPKYACEVYVDNLENDLFARLKDSNSCEPSITLQADADPVVIRYSIEEEQRDSLRFVGTLSTPPCTRPVTEEKTCDATKSPFEGLSCARLNESSRLAPCRVEGCASPLNALCYRNLTETSVDLQVSNTNNCYKNDALLNYLIAVKALRPTRLNKRDFYRQYLVDPSVVQVPNCPGGICAEEPRSP
ncbi:MAG: hypothetical protein AAFX50_00630 [Acidobacteriota bacterium]